MPRKTLADWLAWQEKLHPRSIDLELGRVRDVAARLGVLSFSRPVIIVGGTNGKGSCVALLESILAAGGYRVGAFTSPHLLRYNERIRIAGRLAADAELSEAFERIDAARGDVSLTFFEFNTLAALLLFKQASLDVLILEVGLGGRLDATNIVDADAALLTSVELDHCDWLGDTRELIGREKAGIFRPGRPAILGSDRMPESVFDVADAIGAHLKIADHALLEGMPAPALPGQHQLINAAAVLTVLHTLRDRLPLTRKQITRGLVSVKLAGRFQRWPGQPEWVFDVAHNPDAAAALAANLALHPVEGRTIAVVGVLADKDVAGVIAPLLPLVDMWVAATLTGPRALTAAALIERAGVTSQNTAARWLQADSVEAACALAMTRAGPPDRIVVFGSFHTVGPALEWKGAAGETD